MAQSGGSRRRATQNRRPAPFDGGASPLWRCVGYSGLVHVAFIWTLWIIPQIPLRPAPAYPVYTVDLVGGEKLGGTNLGTERSPPRPKREPRKAREEPLPRAEPAKKAPPSKEIAKREETTVRESPKVETAKKEITKLAEKPAPLEEAVKATKPKTEPVEQAAEVEKLPDQVRERLIQAALERVRERAEADKRAETTAKAATPREKEMMSAGPGEGVGAATPGTGGRGGGIVKAFEFIAYRNQMLRMIKDRWTWVGRRSDLEVTVRFGIQENGHVFGLRILRPSGDPSYDDSVVRAVRKASPLPPPPENYRREFMDVELTFLPKDLGG